MGKRKCSCQCELEIELRGIERFSLFKPVMESEVKLVDIGTLFRELAYDNDMGVECKGRCGEH